MDDSSRVESECERKSVTQAFPFPEEPKPLRNRILSGNCLFLLGIISLAISLCLPGAGWINRHQLGMLVGRNLPIANPILKEFAPGLGENESTTNISRRQEADYARSVPGDLEVQIAEAAASTPPSPQIADAAQKELSQSLRRVDALIALKPRFNNRPELHAAILRFLCQGVLPSIPRYEGYLFAREEADPAKDEKARESYYEDQARLDPNRLTQFDVAATLGEDSDPNNAFFPQMHAAALFAMNRDTEAIAALHRAAQKSLWNDYVNTEVWGRFREVDHASGEVGFFARSAVAASLLFPHYATLRSMARVAVYDAALKEQAGDVTTGFSIRHDLGRIGALMRVQGTSFISALVGSATVSSTAVCPDGVRALKSGDDPILNRARTLSAYISYLNRTGHNDEATWFLAEQEKEAIVKHLGNELDKGVSDFQRMRPLMAVWFVSLMILTNALTILLFGGAATLLNRLSHFRNARPLALSVRMGFVASGFVFGMLVYGVFHMSEEGLPFETLVEMVGMSILSLAVIFLSLKHKVKWPELRSRLIYFALTILGVATACGVLFLGTRGLASEFNGMWFLGLFSWDLLFFGIGIVGDSPLMPFALLLGTIAPGIVILTAFCQARRQNLPASVAAVRKLRYNAAGVAGVLLLIVALLSGPICVLELRSSKELNQVMQHEGRYISNGTWPGLVGETTHH